MTTKFELDKEQQVRMNAWFKHHWDVVHQGWRPPDRSGFAGHYRFGPTMDGCNVDYECAWCVDGSPSQKVILTTDDDGEFIYPYDENWKRLPASWEQKPEEKKP
jgi:hypothetical protein